MTFQTGSGRVRSLIAATFTAAAFVIAGCSDRTQIVEVSGPAPGRDVPLAVDVTNTNGSVLLRVDPRLTEPHVTFEVHAANVKTETKRTVIDTQGTTVARGVEKDGRYVLTVEAKCERGSPDRPFVDVEILVPRCDGLYVRNSGGPVELVGVSGAVQVENGVGGEAGGRIEVRTAAPMHEPVRLVTSHGPIYFQVGPDSSGQFDLTAEDGDTEFRAYVGSVTGAQNYNDHCTCTLNGGENTVTLRSRRGVVRALVTTNPVESIPYRMDVQEKFLGDWSHAEEADGSGS